MNSSFDLKFCFKGKRTYVQGPDIFDMVIKILKETYVPSVVSDIKYSAHNMLYSNATLFFVDKLDKADFKKINSIVTFKVLDKKISAVVEENNSKIKCSVEYNENIIRNKAIINSDKITFQNVLKDSLTEIIVSMNKYYLQESVTKEGKWIVTKFEYSDLIELENIDGKQIELHLLNNFNNKLTKSKICVNDKALGFIYFSLV